MKREREGERRATDARVHTNSGYTCYKSMKPTRWENIFTKAASKSSQELISCQKERKVEVELGWKVNYCVQSLSAFYFSMFMCETVTSNVQQHFCRFPSKWIKIQNILIHICMIEMMHFLFCYCLFCLFVCMSIAVSMWAQFDWLQALILQHWLAQQYLHSKGLA